MTALTIASWGYTVAGVWVTGAGAAMFLAAGAGRMRDVRRGGRR